MASVVSQSTVQSTSQSITQSTTQSTSQSVPESIPPPFNKWIASGVLVGGLIAFGMYFPQPGPLVMDLANSNEELTV